MRWLAKWIVAATVVTLALAGMVVPDRLGRTRPDLAAWLSFDDGPLTFSHLYTSGSVGSFAIGNTHTAALEKLSSYDLPPQDRLQLTATKPEWIFTLPVAGGGYAIYTLKFTGDRITSIHAFYSVFSGL